MTAPDRASSCEMPRITEIRSDNWLKKLFDALSLIFRQNDDGLLIANPIRPTQIMTAYWVGPPSGP